MSIHAAIAALTADRNEEQLALAQIGAADMQARPYLRQFVLTIYLPARPLLRDPVPVLNAVTLANAFAGREVYCDELSRKWLLAFRDWRLATRPTPVCQAIEELPLFRDQQGLVQPHNTELVRSRGLVWKCPRRGCATRIVHAPPAKVPTVNKDIAQLRAIWREMYEYRDGDQADDEPSRYNRNPPPRIKRMIEELAAPECWSPEEFSRIVAAAARAPGNIGRYPAGKFHKALLLTDYDTGARVDAIMRAAPANLDLTRGTLTLQAATQKQRKFQTWGLAADTLAALAAIYDPQAPRLFTWPYDRGRGWQKLTDAYREILCAAGLPSTEKDLFHKIRRTTATMICAQLGIEAAKEHLGHSSTSVTWRYIDRRFLPSTHTASRCLPRPT